PQTAYNTFIISMLEIFLRRVTPALPPGSDAAALAYLWPLRLHSAAIGVWLLRPAAQPMGCAGGARSGGVATPAASRAGQPLARTHERGTGRRRRVSQATGRALASPRRHARAGRGSERRWEGTPRRAGAHGRQACAA